MKDNKYNLFALILNLGSTIHSIIKHVTLSYLYLLNFFQTFYKILFNIPT